VVPIGDIVWSFGQSNHDGQELLQIPEIDVPMQSAGNDVRYYVYKFRSSGQYFSSECSGVLCRLTHSYRRLVHARDYDLIIRNETLRKTIFIEQAVKPDVSVLQKGTRASDYGELQAIMDYTRGHRATTHSATPPSQDEELKASITVPRPLVYVRDPFIKIIIKVHTGAYFVCAFDLSLDQHHTQAGTTPERDGGSRHGIHHSATKYTSEKRHRVVRSRQCAGVQAGIRAGNQCHSLHALHFRRRRTVNATGCHSRQYRQLADKPGIKNTVW